MSDHHRQTHSFQQGNCVEAVPQMHGGVCIATGMNDIGQLFRDWWVSGPCMVLGFLVVFSPLIDGGTTQLPVLVIRLVLLGVLVVWLFGRLREGTVDVPSHRLAVPIALFAGFAFLSLLWTPYKNPSAQWLLTILTYALLFGIVTQGIRSEKQIWALVMVLMWMGVGEGILGIVQYLWLNSPRPRGTFFNPNFFAEYEAVVLILAFSLLLFSHPAAQSRFMRGCLWGTMSITFLAFVMAQSRGAFLALIGTVALVGLAKFGKKAVAVILLCLAVGVLVPNPLYQRLIDAGSQDPYAYTRLEIWKSSLNRILDQPLGIGLGMFKYGSFQDRFPIDGHIVRYWKRPESAHNEYLQIGVELGVVGLALFLWGIGISAWETRHLWRESRPSSDRGLVIGLTAVALGLMVHAGVDSIFHEPALAILLILAVGFLHNMYCRARADIVTSWRIPFPFHPGRAAIVALSGIILAGMCVQPAAAWYAHEQGKHEARLGKIAAALTWYLRAASIDPGTTGYHDSAARTAVELFHDTGNPEWLVKAAEEESMAMDLNKLDGRFGYRLATIYRLMADQRRSKQQRDRLLEKAANCYAEAIHADPYSPSSYFELAQLRVADGRVGEAISLLRTAKAHEPNFLPGRALLAELSLKTGLPGDYRQEFTAIKAVLSTYENSVTNETERQFLTVDLYPLGRALALEPTG